MSSSAHAALPVYERGSAAVDKNNEDRVYTASLTSRAYSEVESGESSQFIIKPRISRAKLYLRRIDASSG